MEFAAIVGKCERGYDHDGMPRTPAEPDPDTIAFMEQVMAGIGVTNATDLADLLVREQLLHYRESRKVFKWVSGEHHPDGPTTRMLLERAGLLPT